jgi:DNA-binding transcriptional regulator YiaG
MSLKSITVKRYKFSSPFGEQEFKNVKVNAAVRFASQFDQDKVEHYLPIDEAIAMEREVAKKWLREKIADDTEISASETRVILSMVGVSATDFAEYIGISKSKLSKVLHGSQALSDAARLACLRLLDFELAFPGKTKLGLYRPIFSSEPEWDAAKLA